MDWLFSLIMSQQHQPYNVDLTFYDSCFAECNFWKLKWLFIMAITVNNAINTWLINTLYYNKHTPYIYIITIIIWMFFLHQAAFYSTALKTLISVSTVILLGLIVAYHALEVQVSRVGRDPQTISLNLTTRLKSFLQTTHCMPGCSLHSYLW